MNACTRNYWRSPIWTVMNDLKECAASIFRVKESWLPKDGGSTFLQNVDKLPTRLQSVRILITEHFTSIAAQMFCIHQIVEKK
jgi:hypothetical protein